MTKGYSYLPHTADVKVKLDASRLEELFEVGLEAMNDILKPGFCNEQKPASFELELQITSPDITALLIDFMSDVLTSSLANFRIYCRLTSIEIQEFTLHAVLEGVPVDRFDEEIKAVTYHEAEIEKMSNGSFSTLVVFDI